MKLDDLEIIMPLARQRINTCANLQPSGQLILRKWFNEKYVKSYKYAKIAILKNEIRSNKLYLILTDKQSYETYKITYHKGNKTNVISLSKHIFNIDKSTYLKFNQELIIDGKKVLELEIIE